MTREVDFGWWNEPDGRRARLSWSEDLGGTVYIFHATGESEALCAGVAESEVRAMVDALWAKPDRSLEAVRAASDKRWPL